MSKKNPEEELFTNFYEELPDDDPDLPDDPEPEPGDDDKPVEGEPSDDKPEPGSGDEPADDEPADKPKKDPRDQPVPFSRFQKERNERKRLERELAEAKGQKPPADDKPNPDDEPDEGEPGEGTDDEPELDERSQKALQRFLKDKGYKSQEEIDAEVERQTKLTEARSQIEKDVSEMDSWTKENGYPPFNAVEVDEWADKHLGKNFVKNRAALEAAYMAMHKDEIREQERKAALADAGEPTAAGERPGAGAKAVVPGDEPVPGQRGYLKSLIHKSRKEIDEGK